MPKPQGLTVKERLHILHSDNKILPILESELFAAFLEHLNVNFFVIDAEGRYILNNSVLDEIIGHNKQANIFRRDKKLFGRKG